MCWSELMENPRPADGCPAHPRIFNSQLGYMVAPPMKEREHCSACQSRRADRAEASFLALLKILSLYNWPDPINKAGDETDNTCYGDRIEQCIISAGGWGDGGG